MKSKKIISLFAAPLFALGIAACDVDQTEEGDMPDIEVEEGELPAYDVQPADVDINQDTVTVPDIDINDADDTTGIEPEGGEVR